MLNSKWELDKPKAATIDEWHDWKTETKRKYPIRYFLQETLPNSISTWWLVHIGWPIRDLYWNIKYRFIPKHKHHVINTGLKPNYYQIDTLMLHGCFNLLKTFYEEQINHGHVDWEADEHHKETWKKITELYLWWEYYHDEKKREENELIPYPKLPSDKESLYYIMSERERDNPVVQKWHNISDKNEKIKEQWIAQEEEMLIRLIKIRAHLWD